MIPMYHFFIIKKSIANGYAKTDDKLLAPYGECYPSVIMEM